MARPQTADHHKRAKPEQWSETRVAIIRSEGRVITCSCGWDDHHRRTKIREDKAESHVSKRHGGQAMWL